MIRLLRTLRQAVEAEPTDGQLLEAYTARRDGSAFAELVRRHGPTVWGVCRRLLLNREDAEDAYQATFLVLVRKPKSVRLNRSGTGSTGSQFGPRGRPGGRSPGVSTFGPPLSTTSSPSLSGAPSNQSSSTNTHVARVGHGCKRPRWTQTRSHSLRAGGEGATAGVRRRDQSGPCRGRESVQGSTHGPGWNARTRVKKLLMIDAGTRLARIHWASSPNATRWVRAGTGRVETITYSARCVAEPPGCR